MPIQKTGSVITTKREDLSSDQPTTSNLVIKIRGHFGFSEILNDSEIKACKSITKLKDDIQLFFDENEMSLEENSSYGGLYHSEDKHPICFIDDLMEMESIEVLNEWVEHALETKEDTSEKPMKDTGEKNVSFAA